MDQEAYWRDFAHWATSRAAPPAAARARAVDALLDTAACWLAGRDAPAARAAQRSAAGAEGTAFALAVAAHALDWDDYDVPSVGHPSAVILPAVLALSVPLSGHRALDAYLIGLEAMDRLGEVMNPEHYEAGWHATGTLGTIAAAMASAAALELDAPGVRAALSLSAGMASGLKAQFGAAAKPVTAGLAARNGVIAAMLAGAGISGNAAALTGDRGFMSLHGPADWRRRSPGQPGAPWAILQYGLIAKPHPCCGYLSRIVDGALAVAARPGFSSENIAAVRVEAPRRNAAVLPFADPVTPDEARFSPAYCVAAALATGRLGPDDFTALALARPTVRTLLDRITFRANDAPQSADDLSPDDPDLLTIEWLGAPPETLTLRHMRGGPAAPLTRVDFREKLAGAGAEGAALAPLIESLETDAPAAPVADALSRALGLSPPTTTRSLRHDP